MTMVSTLVRSLTLTMFALGVGSAPGMYGAESVAEGNVDLISISTICVAPIFAPTIIIHDEDMNYLQEEFFAAIERSGYQVEKFCSESDVVMSATLSLEKKERLQPFQFISGDVLYICELCGYACRIEKSAS